jgi:uncharacterized membrane protein YbhN (UPF0104 family)
VNEVAAKRSWSRIGRVLSRAVPPILLALAAYILWRELHVLSPREVGRQMADWGPARLALVAALTVVGYGVLGVNEALGLRWAGAKLAWREVSLVSFLAYAFANNLGLNMLVAGVVRSRAYGRSGVDVPSVAVATVYCSLAFTVGLCVLAGASLLTADEAAYAALRITARTGHVAGALFLLYPTAYLLACTLWRRPVGAYGRNWTLPGPGRALSQIGLGLVDNLVIAGVLWLLIGERAPSYVDFTSAYALSMAAGLLSNLPGGVGVFESVMLTLLPQVDRAAMAATFIGYRLIYFLTPLVVAIAVMAFRERALASQVLAGFRRKRV